MHNISLLLQINARCLAPIAKSNPKASVSAIGTTIFYAIEKTPADVKVKTSAEAKVTTAAEDEEQGATYTDDMTATDGGNVTIVVAEEASPEVMESAINNW